MNAPELRPSRGYRLLGCQYIMKNWFQIVRGMAIRGSEPHTSSEARRIRLEHEVLSNVFKDWDD